MPLRASASSRPRPPPSAANPPSGSSAHSHPTHTQPSSSPHSRDRFHPSSGSPAPSQSAHQHRDSLPKRSHRASRHSHADAGRPHAYQPPRSPVRHSVPGTHPPLASNASSSSSSKTRASPVLRYKASSTPHHWESFHSFRCGDLSKPQSDPHT